MRQPERHEFVDYVIELLGPFGTVSAKRMFGGHGIYLDGLMFALVAREALWLKADEINKAEFVEAGCEHFTYTRSGASASIGFYRAPADAMESPQDMLGWARSAYAAALRANAKRAAAENARAARAAETVRKPKHPRRTATKKKVATTRAAAKRPATKRPIILRSARPTTRHRGKKTKR